MSALTTFIKKHIENACNYTKVRKIKLCIWRGKNLGENLIEYIDTLLEFIEYIVYCLKN